MSSDNFDPNLNNQIGRAQKDDGEYDMTDAVTNRDQSIPENMVMDDEALEMGERYAQNSDGITGLYDVIASPGAQDRSTYSEWEDSADNLTIHDGRLQNTGDEDEAVKQEEIARMSEGYGSDIAREGHDRGVLFDSIARNTEDMAIGGIVKTDSTE